MKPQTTVRRFTAIIGPLVMFSVLGVFAQSVQASLLSGPIINPANGNSYYLLETSTWTDAEAEAIALGGNLVAINNAAENAFVSTTFDFFGGVQRFLWIGLNDVATEGTFVWSNGQPVTYSNFDAGEPNDDAGNPAGGEDYVWMYAIFEPQPRGTWNDVWNGVVPGTGTINGVVEVPDGVVDPVPEPSLASLVGLALIGLLDRSRRRRRRRCIGVQSNRC